MQIFTLEQLVGAWHQSRETAQILFSSIVDAAWQNVGMYLGQTIEAIQLHEWNTLIASSLVLAGTVVLLYRLIRRNLGGFIRHTFD